MTDELHPAPTRDVEVERRSDVGIVTFSRPPHNFFDRDLISSIADALDALDAAGARAVVLRSEGRPFCAGAALRVGAAPTPGPHLYEVALRLFMQPLPLVVAVQGAAVGGGMGLALAGDMRVAGPEARFHANFAQIGFHHGFGMTVSLPAVVGVQKAADLLLTARKVGADEALRIGLCDRVSRSVDPSAEALDLAEAIAANAPIAVRSMRATMRADLIQALPAAIARERDEQAVQKRTADWVEGVTAVRERRKPVFTGQ